MTPQEHDLRCYAPEGCIDPDYAMHSDCCDKCQYNLCTCEICEEKRKEKP